MSAQKEAKLYAQAVLKTALEEWLAGLQHVQRALHQQPDLLPRLDDPGTSPAAKESLLAHILPREARPEVHNFVRLLVREHDLKFLDDVLAELEGVLEGAGAALRTAEITTAVPLSAEDRAALEAELVKQFGDSLLFEYTVDPSVIGGVRVRVGDRVIDGTIAGRFNAMRERLLGG
ncbi:MAG: ATP synthase F1 subunit delta [Ardenticatenia bacterium]|nr:ATP synthase F1 subunit delta [Ardenticatenia bacterium]